jgi:uncharacterized protein (TIGR02147 family)
MAHTCREILFSVFTCRARQNPSYSRAAFARDLSLSPSALSEILSGKKGLSPARAESVASCLHLPEWQGSLFKRLAVEAYGRSPAARAEAKAWLDAQAGAVEVERQKAEVTEALTSWLDLAILETTHLKNFRPEEPWIADHLGVTLVQVVQAKERLLRVGLLKIERGVWSDESPYFTTSDGVPSAAVKNFHRNFLRLAEKKIDGAPIEERVLKATVFSVDSAQEKEARAILDEAISKIMALSAEGYGKKDKVFAFGAQLIQLSRETLQ